VYTMADLFDNKILCKDCDRVMTKGFCIKDGFKIRFLQCPKCHSRTFHPVDKKEYDDFNEIKKKEWNVKLRMVGNSYAVSIPREIIEFEEQFQREMNNIIRMTLEEPTKLSLFLTKRKLIK